MIDRALCSDDDYIPKKETKPDRSRGGSSSGVPPNFRIATEQEDWERPFVASKEPALRVPPDLVFGIDFGDQTTRIAAASAARLALVGPKIVPTSIGVGEGSQAWESKWWFESQIGQLRNRIRNHETLTIDGRELKAHALGVKFFAKLRDSIELMTRHSPRVVLNVPSFYTQQDREELALVVDSAGFKVLDTINDYASPVLAFARMGEKRNGNILSIAIGSKSLSIAILESLDGTVKTIAANSAATFGSCNLVQAFGDHWNDNDFDATSEYLEKIKANREIFRIEFSRVKDLSESVLDASGRTFDNIGFVILNGKIVTNSTVQQTLATFFPGKRIAIVNPDKASAFGAALHASVIVGLNAIPLLNDIRPDC